MDTNQDFRRFEPIAVEEPLPKSFIEAHRWLRLAILASALLVSIGMGYLFWAGPRADFLAERDRDVLVAAVPTTAIAPLRVNLLDTRDVAKAAAAMDLPEREAMKVIGDAMQGKVVLAWLAVSDFLDEDGDVV